MSQPAPAARLEQLVPLLERDVQTALARSRPACDEPEREHRLADARRAEQQRRVAARNAAAQRVVQPVHAEGRAALDHPHLRRAASSRGAGRPRTRQGDPEAVLARHDLAPAHLQDPQPAPVDRTVRLVLEQQDPVGDRELGLGARLGDPVLADEDQDGVAVRDLAREVVDRAPQVLRVDDVVQRLAAVEHDHVGRSVKLVRRISSATAPRPSPLGDQVAQVHERDCAPELLASKNENGRRWRTSLSCGSDQVV